MAWESFTSDYQRINNIGLVWDAVPGATAFEIQYVSHTNATAPLDPNDVTGWQTLNVSGTPAVTFNGNSATVYNLERYRVNYFRIRAFNATDTNYNSYSTPRLAYTDLFPLERVGMAPLVNLTDYPNRTSLDPNINDFVEPTNNTAYDNSFGLKELRATFGADENNDQPKYPSLHGFLADENHFVTRTTSPKFINTTSFQDVTYGGSFGNYIDHKQDDTSYSFTNNPGILYKRVANGSGGTTQTLIRDFSSLGYSFIGGVADSQFSWDMDLVPLQAVDGGNFRCVVYRVSTDTIIADFVTLDPQGGGYSISPLGNYLFINASAPSAASQNDVYTIVGDTITFAYSITLDAGHHAYGLSAQNNEFYLFTDGGFNLYGLRFFDGKLFMIQGGSSSSTGDFVHVSYISGSAIYSGGWAFVSNFDGRAMPGDRSNSGGNLGRDSYHKNYAIYLDETKMHDMNGNQSNTITIDNQLIREYSYSHAFYGTGGNDGGSDSYPNPSRSGALLGFSKVDYGYSNVNVNGYSNLNTYFTYRDLLHGDEIPFGGVQTASTPINDFLIGID